MADVKVNQQKNHEQQNNQSSTAMQTTGRGTPSLASGGLARRGSFLPSLSARELFNTSPFELMRRFSEEMDRAFENFGMLQGWSFGGNQTTSWSPAVEVFERDNNLVVRADLPGLTKDDIKVEMTDQGLCIQGERKREHEEKGEGFYRTERSYGQFYRLVPLPEEVNAEQVKAEFNNGVLEIVAQIPEASRRRRAIPITVGGKEQAQTASGSGKK
jgi:HSP20 family protein